MHINHGVCSGPRGRLRLGGAGTGAGQPWHPPALPVQAESPRAAGADGTWRGRAGSRAGTAAETCCHLLLLFPDPNLTPLPSSAPLQPCPISFNCSHIWSPAFAGVPDTLPHMLYHTRLVQPFAPPATCKASPKSLFSFSWGAVWAGCLGKII